jgi:hypothetical protein
VLPALASTANDTDYAAHSVQARDGLHQTDLSVRFTPNTLLHEYAGPLAGETSTTIDLS